jgi:hypothetical protein
MVAVGLPVGDVPAVDDEGGADSINKTWWEDERDLLQNY